MTITPELLAELKQELARADRALANPSIHRNHLRELIEWGEGLERDVSDLAQMDVENAATIESLHNQLDEANEEIARLRGDIE